MAAIGFAGRRQPKQRLALERISDGSLAEGNQRSRFHPAELRAVRRRRRPF